MLPVGFSGLDAVLDVLANPDAGPTVSHQYPPILPTNAYSTLFPSDMEYEGATPTGDEAALVVTAPSYPVS